MKRATTSDALCGWSRPAVPRLDTARQDEISHPHHDWIGHYRAGGNPPSVARIVAKKLGEARGSVVIETQAAVVDRSAPTSREGLRPTATHCAPQRTFRPTTSACITGRAKPSSSDFAPVSLAANVPLVVMCHPSCRRKT